MDKSQLRIAKPCTVDWAAMTPADRGRFCADCKKVVHDLSTMTERQAREMLGAERASEVGMCVRFVYDRHGKVFFGGGKAPMLSASFLNRAKRAAAVASLALPLALEACSPNLHDDGGTLMGEPAFVEADAADPDAGGDAADAADARDEKNDAANTGDAAGDAGPDADTDGGYVPPI